MGRMWLKIGVLLVILVLIVGVSTSWFGAKGKSGPKMAVCPVCKMKVLITENTPTYQYKGKTYYFMSEEHKQIFLEDPERFLK